METNFFGTVNTTTAFLPLLEKSEQPVVLNVTTDMSCTTQQAQPGIPSFLHLVGYNPSKAALNSYTVALAREFPRFRVNAVSPGWTQTKLNAFTGPKTAEGGAQILAPYALLDKDGPTCQLFMADGERTAW